MIQKLRSQLFVKFLLSYLAVIGIGLLVQAAATQMAIPSAFRRHMGDMPMMREMMRPPVEVDLLRNFRSGVFDALAIAGLAATLAAVVVSVWFSRRLTAPLQAMTQASHRIADGHYDQRVPAGQSADPDELGQLAQAFNQMAARLEQTEQMRLQLIGDVSHELRTPLTAIKGSMEALIDGVLPPEPATFEQIEQEADRLQRLVNDLQELSRVEAGAYQLELQPLDMVELARTALQRLEGQFVQKGIALSSHFEPGLPLIQGDADRLLQVILNLLSNACQYTPAGGAVQLRLEPRGGDLLLSVDDNGEGIATADMPQLFTRFYRADKSRSRQAGGGSGIGLTIARHFVEAHRGKIWAESAGPGLGSTFFVLLPVK